jgi:multiple sugar transport system permease protein
MKKRTKDALVAYSFIAPNFLGFAVFTLVPLIFALALSFLHWDGANPIRPAGLTNFARLALDGTFWRAMLNTILYTAGVVPLTMTFALFLAILCYASATRADELFYFDDAHYFIVQGI